MLVAKWLGFSATVRVRDREWAFRTNYGQGVGFLLAVLKSDKHLCHTFLAQGLVHRQWIPCTYSISYICRMDVYSFLVQVC